jgi:hypothetical protein
MKEVYNNLGILVEVSNDTPVKDIDGKKYLHTPEQQAEYDALQSATIAEQTDYIANHKYKDDRETAYGSIQDQLDMMYWDQVNGTSTWKDHVNTVKTTHPKPGA